MENNDNKDEKKVYSELQLRVAEAVNRDVGRGIARISPEYAKKVGLESRDIITIQGIKKGKKTAAVVWTGYPEDANRGIIRIDALIRKNAGVVLDDTVTIKKVKADPCTSVTVSFIGNVQLKGGESSLVSFLRNRLEGRVLTKKDIILLPVYGRKLELMVSGHSPSSDAVVMTASTQVKLGQNVDASQAESMPTITYDEIGGLHDEITRIREMVELPIKHPELFEKIGIDPPKGVLLHGPPGTGKTLLARAVASETEAKFYSIKGPEIMSKYYGESEQRVRQIFNDAAKNAPSIIFIDEIDSIAPSRSEVTGEVERRVVAQLLSLMDGLESRGDVIVIGATNRLNSIDPALRRPGRFDREIEIGIPNKEERREILDVHARGVPLSPDVDLDHIAGVTHGYVGADLESLLKESGLRAIRRKLPEINLDEEIISPEVLESIQITTSDLNESLLEMSPSGLRELLVEVPNVKWEEIGGLKEVKQKLKEAVEWPLKYSNVFEHMNADAPRGILLYGPPGTGKTLMAKAIATESEANFLSVKGPEFLNKWVGESEKAVRDLFKKARSAAPSVVFLDEIDTIATARGKGNAGNNVTERIVSQLLTELDGLEELKGVIVIGATNRPELIDPALLRPGRFDQIIEAGLPDDEARADIFRVHTKSKPLNEDVNFNKLVEGTTGMSGAEIASIVKEATFFALRRIIEDKTFDISDSDSYTSKKINNEDFQQAMQAIRKMRGKSSSGPKSRTEHFS